MRIGPPSIKKENFLVERNGKIVKGKREEIPKFLNDMGLNLYEYQAGRGIKFKKKEDLADFRNNCIKHNIFVSIHGPYYISLCSENQETLQRSIERIGELYQGALWLGAKRAVFHPGSYGKNGKKEEKLKMVIKSIKKGIELAEINYPEEFSDFKDIALCPETMGKHGQLGPLEDIITICREVGTEKCIPTIDFGHIYARRLGKLKTKKDFLKILEQIEQELGKKVAENLHIHYSQIEYTKKGEKKHHPLSVKKWGPDFKPMLEIINELGYKPSIVIESPDLEEDAKLIMDFYRETYQ
ncbi:MAG: TIM barrel protein [archaeon]|nr:TIM barrel protein [archaeon]